MPTSRRPIFRDGYASLSSATGAARRRSRNTHLGPSRHIFIIISGSLLFFQQPRDIFLYSVYCRRRRRRRLYCLQLAVFFYFDLFSIAADKYFIRQHAVAATLCATPSMPSLPLAAKYSRTLPPSPRHHAPVFLILFPMYEIFRWDANIHKPMPSRVADGCRYCFWLQDIDARD